MGPLSGMTVVEVGGFITAPYAGQLMADLGARVIKVEMPGSGDPFRSWQGGTYSPHFLAYNRSKLSVTLDLKQSEGREAFLKLIEHADAFIENFRPGVADRLGLSYKELSAINERLVYCSISGFGDDGPYAMRPAFDTVGQALSGLLAATVDPAEPRLRGPAVSDSLTGLFAAYGLLGGLVSAQRTGKGQRVATSLLESSVAYLLQSFAMYFINNVPPTVDERPRISQAYILGCADDRRIAIHMSSPQVFWVALCSAIDRTDLTTDPRFVTHSDRLAHYDEIEAILRPVFATADRDTWSARLSEAGVPHAPVLELDEVLQDPQVRHLGLEQRVEHPEKGPVRLLGFPVRYSGTPLPESAAPPVLSEHSDAVLAEVGYSPEEIQRLRSNGII